MDFEEFTEFLRAHEKRLRLMFSSLDHNHDGQHRRISIALTSSVYPTLVYRPVVFVIIIVSGQIDVGEIQLALHNLGVDVTLEEASRILQRSVHPRHNHIPSCSSCTVSAY